MHSPTWQRSFNRPSPVLPFFSFPSRHFLPSVPRNCFTLRLHLEERCAPDRQLFFILSCPLQGRARRKIEQQTVGCSVFDTLARLRVLYLSLFHKVEVFQRYVRNCRLSVSPDVRVYLPTLKEFLSLSFSLSLSCRHAVQRAVTNGHSIFTAKFPPLW